MLNLFSDLIKIHANIVPLIHLLLPGLPHPFKWNSPKFQIIVDDDSNEVFIKFYEKLKYKHNKI